MKLRCQDRKESIMVKYILVAVLQVSGGNSLTVHDFTSKLACEAASKLITDQEANNADAKSYGYSVDCIPDDDNVQTIKAAKDAIENLKDDLPIHESHDDLPIHKD
jgi:hypothetical protein